MIGSVIMCIGLGLGFLTGFTIGFVVVYKREHKPEYYKPQEIIEPKNFYEHRKIETLRIAQLIDERDLMSFGDEFIEHCFNQMSAKLGKSLKDNGFINFRIIDNYSSYQGKEIIAYVQAVKQEGVNVCDTEYKDR